MNHDQSSLSEILFFGMRLKAGQEEVYSIENADGQMEICHLTNCALVSESTSRKPIYVRMKNPDVDSEFVIGALVPGQVYSFQTDLLITPDTSFSHSGGPQDEVHLTGYRYGPKRDFKSFLQVHRTCKRHRACVHLGHVLLVPWMHCSMFQHSCDV